MKEHPVLFNSQMVKAILDGRKTQTRRVIKPQPRLMGNQFTIKYYDSPKIGVTEEKAVPKTWLEYGCPYGQVGDRLWVRETWATGKGWGDSKPSELPPNEVRIYTKDDPLLRYGYAGKWRPSIHMPRWASRITLEITEVRVERVQELWMKDAITEGCSLDFNMEHFGNYVDPVSKFHNLWDSLNAKRGFPWSSNPWCWCISFKQVPDAK